MEDLTYRALHLPLLKVHKPPLRIFDFASMVVLAGAELSVWHVVPLAGRLEFNKATSGRSGPEHSAGVDSGEVKAWSSRGRFWL